MEHLRLKSYIPIFICILLISFVFAGYNYVSIGIEPFILFTILLCVIIYGIVNLRNFNNIKVSTKSLVFDVILIFTICYLEVRSSLSIGYFDTDLLLYCLLFLSSYCLARLIKQDAYINFINFLILFGIFISLIILLQIFRIVPSLHAFLLPTGIFNNPTIAGFFLATIFPLTFKSQVYILEKSKRFIFFTNIIILLGLVATACRAAWLCCFISSMLIYCNYKQIKLNILIHRHRRLTIVFVIAFILILSAIIIFKYKSAYSRLFIWKIAIQTWIDFPFFGVGKSFSYYYMNNQAAFLSNHSSPLFLNLSDNIHTCYNFVLQLLVQYGTVGLCLTLLLIIIIIKIKASEKNIVEKSILIGLICGGFFTYAVYSLPLLILSGFYLGHMISSVQSDNKLSILLLHKCIALSILSILFLITVTFGISLCLWEKGRNLSKASKYFEAIKVYETAKPVLYSNGFFLNDISKCYYYTGNYQMSIKTLNFAFKNRYSSFSEIIMGDNYKALGEFKLADKCYKNAIQLLPNSLYPMYCRALFLYDTGAYEEFEKLYSLIMAHYGKRSTFAEIEIKNHIFKLYKSLKK